MDTEKDKRDEAHSFIYDEFRKTHPIPDERVEEFFSTMKPLTPEEKARAIEAFKEAGDSIRERILVDEDQHRLEHPEDFRSDS